MAKFDKLLLKIRNNPQSVTFEDLDKLLDAHGFVRRQPHSGSLHYIYSFGRHRITVPFKRPFVKAVYVKQVLAILDELDVSAAKVMD
ncbi:MAG: hypothetical protein K1X65_14220 [Caldilineales bacterium]|nr:hypothetical protein [Caldilineales bacterium]MCW5859376.1 hypothetical protein [Caldilineales bacterium]